MDNLDEYMSTLTDKTSFNLHSATKYARQCAGRQNLKMSSRYFHFIYVLSDNFSENKFDLSRLTVNPLHRGFLGVG